MNPLSLFEFSFLFYILSFFLTLGSDSTGQIIARMWFGGMLLPAYFIFRRNPSPAKQAEGKRGVIPIFLLGSFLLFVTCRAILAFAGAPVSHTADSYIDFYLTSARRSAFYLGFLVLALDFLP